MTRKTQEWDAQSYAKNGRFVATLAENLIDDLAPQTHESILDLGCGDGALSAKIAPLCHKLLCLDTSKSMVEASRQRGLDAHCVDAHKLSFTHQFDAVFSNAALHWMTKPEQVATGVFNALKPGGRFVAEFGGAGNVQSIVKAVKKQVQKTRC